MAVLLIVLFAWIASSCGQTVLIQGKMLVHRPLDRFVYGCALGLGIAAYGVLALGLCGLLFPGAIAGWWAILAVIGIRGMRLQFLDVIAWLQSARTEEK